MKASAIPCLLLAVIAAGCTTWRLTPDRLATPVPQREPLQIWAQGQAFVVHGIERHGDSIRVVRRWRPPACASCAQWLPLAAVDSVRTRRYSSARTLGLLGGVAVVLIVYGFTQIPTGVP